MSGKVSQSQISLIHRRSSTNNVLERKDTASHVTTYYIPCYIRFKCKTITDINFQKLSGSVAGTLIFSFYYGGLDNDIRSQFTVGIKKQESQDKNKEKKKNKQKKKYIILQFSRQQSIQLKQDKDIVIKQDKEQQIITYKIRRQFVCELNGENQFYPFQIINLDLMMTVRPLQLYSKYNLNKKISIKFNCMDNKKTASIVSHGQKCEFGDYNIAPYLFNARFSNKPQNKFKKNSLLKYYECFKCFKYQCICCCKCNQHQQQYLKQQDQLSKRNQNQKNQKQNKNQGQDKQNQYKSQDQIDNFKQAHFRIALYKYPFNSILAIFVPLWILGFINIFIFFQDRSLADRITAIATLTLAYIAFIPTINDQIPKTPQIKWVDRFVYLEILASMLCLIQSFLGKDESQDYDWRTDGFYIATITINLFTVFSMTLVFFVHKFCWQKQYAKLRYSSNQDLIRSQWSNAECDQIFSKHIKQSISLK